MISPGSSSPAAGRPGFDLLVRRRNREWVRRNALLLRAEPDPRGEALVLVLTTAMGEAGHEVALCESEQAAAELADEVLSLVARLGDGAVEHSSGHPPSGAGNLMAQVHVPAPAPAARPRRRLGTPRDLVLSMIILIGLVLLLVSVLPRHHHDPVQEVDYRGRLAVLAGAVPYQLLGPAGLPPRVEGDVGA